jgi:DNA-binding SARP family transcriptional activator
MSRKRARACGKRFLRHFLGKDVIVTSQDTISLEPQSISCDVAWFEMLVRQGGRDALGEALDLYKDRFLSDLTLAEAGWSDWLGCEQRRWEEMARNAIVRLGEEELARGDRARAMVLAKRGIAMNALHEDAPRPFMRAAALVGRKAEAVQKYDLLVARLKRDLDAEPEDTTRRLAAQIRARAEAVGATQDRWRATRRSVQRPYRRVHGQQVAT